MNLTLPEVRNAIVSLISLILSIAVHEYGHAIAADKLGDGTPRSQGRVSLNPIVHMDPFGTLLFPLVGLLAGGFMFGWGRPVMVNPMAFTRKLRMKTAHLIVAAAGPFMNVLMAIFVTVLFVLMMKFGVLEGKAELAGGIQNLIYLNWILCFFNLIPTPPLDGGTVLAGILPDRYYFIIEFLERFGFVILFILLLTPGLMSFFLYPAGVFYKFFLNLVIGWLI